MRFHVISCEIFFREMCALLSETPHRCDVEFLPKGLHDLGTEKMQPRLQERIDAVPKDSVDAILLGYGLCNNGIAGLRARHCPLVVPRAHDCITLFMGDRKRYREYFDAHPGTYYRTTGWFEREDTSDAGDITVSQRLGLFLQFDELAAKYGEDNARYIMETMGDSTPHYDRITFISLGLPSEGPFRQRALEEAQERGWTFEEVQGSLDLARKLVFGEWDDNFLIVQPGETLCPSYDEGVIKKSQEEEGKT